MAKAATVAAGNPPANALTTSSGNTLPAINDFSAFDGVDTGLENVQAKDLMIPRLTILQQLSPQLNSRHAEYIEGARMGDFCDTGTGDVFKDGLHILPCFFATVYLEWAPRDSGKGLQGNHGTNASILTKCKKDEKNRYFLDNGNYIAETATYFVLNLSAGGRRSFIPLVSTQLKASRKWMTAITGEKIARPDGSEFTPPIYFRTWKVSAVEQKKANDTWMGWKFSPDVNVLEADATRKLLDEAKNFFEQARDGLVAGDVGEMAEEGSAPSSGHDDNAAM